MISDKRFNRKLKRIQKRGERYKQEKELKEKYSACWPDKKKRRVSNIVLIVVVIAIVAYAAADFILQKTTGYEMNSTLTTCWFSFWGVEIFALAGIKVSKTIRASNDNSCG